MRSGLRILSLELIFLLVVSYASPAGTSEDASYWPGQRWRTSTPEAQGLDSSVLADLLSAIRDRKIRIHSLLIERNGYVVLEAYFFPFQEGETHDIASATKSIISTLIGVAIAEHKLSGTDQPVLPIFSGQGIRNRDARKERITIADLVTMRPGLDCHFDHGELTLKQMRSSSHWVPFMLDLPMASDPGTTFVYCSGGMHVLSGVISRVTGRSAFAYAQSRLFAPLGIREAFWPSDPDGVSTGWGDLRLRPLDMAKIGYLWLKDGRWQGRQVVPAAYLQAAEQVHCRAPWGDQYGYGMWIYPDRRPPIYEANGRGGQRISVVPEKDMVVVMTGGGFEPGDVGAFIGKALKSDAPLPDNPKGNARLAAAVLTAARSPDARPVAPVPSIAATITEKLYDLDDNVLGIKSLTFSFGASSIATLSLVFADGRHETRPVGLDGVPRISSGAVSSQRVALSGKWEGDRTFNFEYDTVGNINSYSLSLTFEGSNLEGSLHEQTGLADTRLHGRMHQPR